jgi:hypothetical protein
MPTHWVYVLYIYLGTKSGFHHMYPKLIGFYNRDEVFTARYELYLLNKTVYTSSLKGETKYSNTVVVRCDTNTSLQLPAEGKVNSASRHGENGPFCLL